MNINYSTPNGTLIPCEGPKAASLSLDFTNTQSITIDFTQQVAMNQISMIQGLFIDNSNNAQSLTILVGGSNQRIIVPANEQGFFPVLAPNPPKFMFSTTGAVILSIFLLNYPVTPIAWETSVQTGGTQNVNIAGASAGVELPVLPPVPGFWPSSVPLSTTGTILSAPYDCTGIQIVTNNAKLAAAGDLTISISDPQLSGIALYQFELELSTTVPSQLIVLETPRNWRVANTDAFGGGTLEAAFSTNLSGGAIIFNVTVA